MRAVQSDTAVIWRRLLTIADAINDQTSTIVDLEAHLLAVDEGFSEAFDPADHYAEYVAVLFCRALRRKLERIVPADT